MQIVLIEISCLPLVIVVALLVRVDVISQAGEEIARGLARQDDGRERSRGQLTQSATDRARYALVFGTFGDLVDEIRHRLVDALVHDVVGVGEAVANVVGLATHAHSSMHRRPVAREHLLHERLVARVDLSLLRLLRLHLKRSMRCDQIVEELGHVLGRQEHAIGQLDRRQHGARRERC